MNKLIGFYLNICIILDKKMNIDNKYFYTKYKYNK